VYMLVLVKEREGRTPSDKIIKMISARSTDRELKRERQRGGTERHKREQETEKRNNGVCERKHARNEYFSLSL